MKKNREWLAGNWEFPLVIGIYIFWLYMWINAPSKGYLNLEEQKLAAGLLKDNIQAQITVASLLIPVYGAVFTFFLSKKTQFTDDERKKISKQLLQSALCMGLSVAVGLYNLAYFPALVLRKACSVQYDNIVFNTAVVFWFRLQLCLFLLGLARTVRSLWKIYRKLS